MPNKDKVIIFCFEIILVLTILFAPLFYGSYLPLHLTLLEFGCLLLLLLFILRISIVGDAQIIYPTGIIFIALFFATLILQLIPFPGAILNFISPRTFHLYKEYAPAAGQGLYTLSLYPLATKEEIVKFFCFFAVFLVTLNFIEKRSQFKRLFLTIIFLGLALSFYGIVAKYFILEKKTTYSFSTFGSRNHFSAYMLMGFSLAVGYSLYCLDKAKKVLFGFIAAIIGATIFLSLSRAGAISLVFTLVLLSYFIRKEGLIKAKYGTFFIVTALLIILVFIVGAGPVRERFALLSQDLFTDRWNMNRDSFAMVRDFPLFGVGLGNFHYCFTQYRNFISGLYSNQMHDDNFQLVVETGLVGATLYFLFLFFLIRNTLIEAEERRDPFVKGMVIAGTCGILGVLFHSFFDFNFHIPAVFFMFWLILGLLYKCAHTHFTYEDKKD